LILVDTCVLLDVVTDDPLWADWSLRQLDAAALRGKLMINAVVYAELSVGIDRVEAVDAILSDAGIEMAEIPRAALFLAGKVFKRYRTAGGARGAILPDFFIGAHAAVSGWPLLTRDVRRYRTYFPSLTLVAPTPG
jgi:predicted nucleic acid-binding protein